MRGIEIGYLLEYGFIRTAIFLLRWLPLGFLSCLAKGGSYLVFPFLRERKRIVLENLRLAFGQTKTEAERRSLAREVLENIFLTFIEAIHLTRPDVDVKSFYQMSPEHDRTFAQGLESGKGVVYLATHLANWEFLAIYGGQKVPAGRQLAVIGRGIKNRRLYNYFTRVRSRTGALIVDKDEAVRKSMGILRKGGGIGILIDQRAGDAGVHVDFFGKPALTTPFPALMKRKYDCTLLPVFCIRERIGRFRILVKEQIPWITDPADDQNVVPTVQAYTRVVEEMVRAYPEQWLGWYHRRWRP